MMLVGWRRASSPGDYDWFLSTGFAGYRFVLHSVGDSLVGRMLTFVDIGPTETLEGPATAVRAACR